MLAQQTLLDPFTLWKSIYEKTEANLNETIHETLQKEAFSEYLGQVQSSYLQYQQFIQNSTDNYLKQINMPTREEISNIASLIIHVEEKVDNIEQKLEDEPLTNPSASEINKLKTSISKLDKKMDQLIKALNKVPEIAPEPSPQANQDHHDHQDNHDHQ